MRYSKLSVTLDSRVAEELDRVPGPRAKSAFVNEAVRRQLQAVRLREMLDRMEEEAGPIPEEVRR